MQLPKRIEAGELVLRPFHEDDRDVFVAFMTCPDNTTHFMFSDDQKTEVGAGAFFASVIESYSTTAPYFVLAIAHRPPERIVGICGISSLPGLADVFEPFVCLSGPDRGKGYATGAIAALISDCFSRKVVSEFRTYIDPDNQRSARMADRLKFSYVARERHPLTGDECRVYVMRASDWQK